MAELGSTKVYGNITVVNDAYVIGDVTANAYFYSSDESLKSDVVVISDVLSKFKKIRGVEFNWKKDGKSSVGLIAQDVRRVFPELVNENDDGVLSLQYGNLVAPLIEAVKELDVLRVSHERRIVALEKEIFGLKKLKK